MACLPFCITATDGSFSSILSCIGCSRRCLSPASKISLQWEENGRWMSYYISLFILNLHHTFFFLPSICQSLFYTRRELKPNVNIVWVHVIYRYTPVLRRISKNRTPNNFAISALIKSRIEFRLLRFTKNIKSPSGEFSQNCGVVQSRSSQWQSLEPHNGLSASSGPIPHPCSRTRIRYAYMHQHNKWADRPKCEVWINSLRLVYLCESKQIL